MAASVDQRSSFAGMGYEGTMRWHNPNPWASTTQTSTSNIYQSPIGPSSVNGNIQQSNRTSSISSSYDPTSATSSLRPDPSRSYATTYGSLPSAPQASYAPTSATQFSPPQYRAGSTYGYEQESSRRSSYPKSSLIGRDSCYSDQIDAGRGMVAMSQEITPRNIYARNGSQDSYGFPTHSANSSISSASGYPQYYAGSYTGSISGSISGSIAGSIAGSSVTDYSSEAENALGSRTLPVPGHMPGAYPPEPSSMMNQFNSKASASTQKKHKCKICDKRFTRPSSLQTHMYSHTGEKPFPCDFDGCGRHFSVVSNLRRHKKCHRSGHEHGGADEE